VDISSKGLLDDRLENIAAGSDRLYKQSFFDKAWLAKYVADVDLTVDELRAENERLKADLEVKNEVQSWRVEWLAMEAENERLRAALTLGQVMLDSLNDENEFNPDTVHAFAVALGELAPGASL